MIFNSLLPYDGTCSKQKRREDLCLKGQGVAPGKKEREGLI